MDLRTVKEDLLGGNYETPTQFAKDMRLIFTNSKNYNTNKRSRVSYDECFILDNTNRINGKHPNIFICKKFHAISA